MWTPVATDALGVAGVETNCIPRKTRPSKIEVSFASRCMIFSLLHTDATGDQIDCHQFVKRLLFLVMQGWHPIRQEKLTHKAWPLIAR
jgi:hypothetical protein